MWFCNASGPLDIPLSLLDNYTVKIRKRHSLHVSLYIQMSKDYNEGSYLYKRQAITLI